LSVYTVRKYYKVLYTVGLYNAVSANFIT
jgi:hypothetical protein